MWSCNDDGTVLIQKHDFNEICLLLSKIFFIFLIQRPFCRLTFSPIIISVGHINTVETEVETCGHLYLIYGKKKRFFDFYSKFVSIIYGKINTMNGYP